MADDGLSLWRQDRDRNLAEIKSLEATLARLHLAGPGEHRWSSPPRRGHDRRHSSSMPRSRLHIGTSRLPARLKVRRRIRAGRGRAPVICRLDSIRLLEAGI